MNEFAKLLGATVAGGGTATSPRGGRGAAAAAGKKAPTGPKKQSLLDSFFLDTMRVQTLRATVSAAKRAKKNAEEAKTE